MEPIVLLASSCQYRPLSSDLVKRGRVKEGRREVRKEENEKKDVPYRLTLPPVCRTSRLNGRPFRARMKSCSI